MKKLILILLFLGPMFIFAQQPKMDIRLYGGIHSSTFVYRAENVDADMLIGWQAGGAFRVSRRKEFFEIDITYVNSGITVAPNEDADIILEEPVEIRLHSLEIPMTIGYIPVKTTFFKWYLYGGLVSKFSLKGKYTYKGETESFKPSELHINWYNLGARIGSQVDVAFLNFDIGYTIGITNAFHSRVRTNTHALQFSVGFLF